MHSLSSLGPLESARDVAQALQTLVTAPDGTLALPGVGRTVERFETLAEVAATDLSLGRLYEGHTDAQAILAEAGLSPGKGRYGVWAAEPPDGRVKAERHRDGWVLHGRKRYASGAGEIERALITAHAADGSRLFDVDLSAAGVEPVADTWLAVGMAATQSLDVVLDQVHVPAEGAVGGPGFYLDRAGFWHGGVGVAACWYGGALGAYRMLHAHLARVDAGDHQVAHLGAVAAACDSMWASLAHAASRIDAAALRREDVLIVRHVVEQGCQEVLLRVGRASGTAPLTFDRAHARRAADLPVYLRQHHAERDLTALGRALLQPK